MRASCLEARGWYQGCFSASAARNQVSAAWQWHHGGCRPWQTDSGYSMIFNTFWFEFQTEVARYSCTVLKIRARKHMFPPRPSSGCRFWPVGILWTSQCYGIYVSPNINRPIIGTNRFVLGKTVTWFFTNHGHLSIGNYLTIKIILYQWNFQDPQVEVRRT